MQITGVCPCSSFVVYSFASGNNPSPVTTSITGTYRYEGGTYLLTSYKYRKVVSSRPVYKFNFGHVFPKVTVHKHQIFPSYTV